MRHSTVAGNPTSTPDVVLLDLNYSLVENSATTMARRLYDQEAYRAWLVPLIRGSCVHLVTVRSATFRDSTLRRIEELTGWRPNEAHFNDRKWSAPAWKAYVLTELILTRFPGSSILAIESNAEVHAVYDRRAVPWVKIGTNDRWSALPEWSVGQARARGT